MTAKAELSPRSGKRKQELRRIGKGRGKGERGREEETGEGGGGREEGGERGNVKRVRIVRRGEEALDKARVLDAGGALDRQGRELDAGVGGGVVQARKGVSLSVHQARKGGRRGEILGC